MIYWFVAAASLLGVWLNIKKRRACFAIWSVTNATWMMVDFREGIHAQAMVQAVYLLLSVYGWVCWSSESREKHETL